jgi:hypothetical protein
MSRNGPRSTTSFFEPVRSYVGRLVTWGKGRVAGYGLAAGLGVIGSLFIVVAASVGIGALFHWIELHYGAWIAYAIIGGFFGGAGIVLLLFALALIKRPAPQLPQLPTAAELLREAVMPSAGRYIVPGLASILSSPSKSARRTDGTTRLLAGGAALLVLGWAITSRAARRPSSEGASR